MLLNIIDPIQIENAKTILFCNKVTNLILLIWKLKLPKIIVSAKDISIGRDPNRKAMGMLAPDNAHNLSIFSGENLL